MYYTCTERDHWVFAVAHFLYDDAPLFPAYPPSLSLCAPTSELTSALFSSPAAALLLRNNRPPKMAAQGKKSTAVASTTVKALRFLIVVSSVALFLVPGNVQLHFAKASTSCVTDGEVCFDDDTCTACVTSIASTGASQSECAEQYSLDTETGDDVCGLFGVAYCCSAELSGQECLTDETTLAYWSCALQNLGCTLDDMPCLDGTCRKKCTILIDTIWILRCSQLLLQMPRCQGQIS